MRELFYIMKYRTKKILTDLSKNLRQNSTFAEKILWEKLRNKQFYGIKFRRQEPIGDYIVDFISFQKNLIIEIDGGYHKKSEQKEYDKYRDNYLKFNDAIILRFTNDDIINNLDKVLFEIKDACGII